MPTKKPYREPATKNRGASIARAEIKAHILAMPTPINVVYVASQETHELVCRDCLLNFIDGMASRADHKPGGLGRKWQAKPKGSKTNRTGER